MESPSVDERDLLIVSALQDAPRARWADLARILEVGEDTIAHRWRHLSSTGQAWISLVDRQHVSGQSLTFILLRTAASQRSRVVSALLPHPLVRTIHHTSGSHDVSVMIESTDAPTIARFLDDSVEPIGGITELQVLPSISVITTAAGWRTRALDGSQRHELAVLDTPPTKAPARTTPASDDPVVQALLQELAVDGRMAVADLQRNLRARHDLDVSASTITRKLQRLLALTSVRIRCDISAPDLGWSSVVMIWCRISSQDAAALCADRAAAERSLRQALPETRSMMVLAGPVNLHLTVWLHTLDDLPDVEVRLTQWIPSVDVVDRTVCLSTAKRMGFALSNGRRSDITGPASAAAELT